MSLFQDAAYSHRLLTSRPGFTVAAALTLALGIGANTAVFSVLRTVVLDRSGRGGEYRGMSKSHGAFPGLWEYLHRWRGGLE